MNIAFRVDASNLIGTGHIFRCLTLADALKKQGSRIRFISRQLPEYLCLTLRDRGHDLKLIQSDSNAEVSAGLRHAHWLGVTQIQDATDTINALKDQNWDWIVVDHYALDSSWETRVRQSTDKIFVIDDIADREHDCDLLLDQNFYATIEHRYDGKVPASCQLLLGPRYSLLRDEFRQLRERVEERSGPIKRVLVFFGGVDPDNYTGNAIKALAGLRNHAWHVDIVIGAQHPYRKQVIAACEKNRIVCHTQTNRMAELMMQADLAIGAGGSTTWERCCMGLPTLVICIAENQRKLMADAACEGLIYAPELEGELISGMRRHLEALHENSGLRQSISRRGIQVVDGHGVSRVIGRMGIRYIDVRLARQDDSEKLLEWRNHPDIRMVSRNSEIIRAEDHKKWLASALTSPDRLLLIGEHKGLSVGVVRFDIEGNLANISIYLVPDTERPGQGIQLLQSAEVWLVANRPGVNRINAYVLGENERSQKFFLNAGYQLESAIYSKRLD